MSYLWVRLLETEPVEIDVTGCRNISGLKRLIKAELPNQLGQIDLNYITLHTANDAPKLRADYTLTFLASTTGFVNNYENPLIVKKAQEQKINSVQSTKQILELSLQLISLNYYHTGDSKTKSLEKKFRTPPLQLEEWPDFDNQVTTFQNSLPNISFEPFSLNTPQSCCNELQVQAVFDYILFPPLRKLLESLSSSGTGNFAHLSGCFFAGIGGLGKAIGDPDRVFIDGGVTKIPKICIEIKPHWASGKSWAGKSVITSYNEELLAFCNAGKAKGAVMLTIEQAYLYMVLNHHRWAIVTSFNHTFVLERVEDVDQPHISKIRVSPTISCVQTQPYNIICAWAYVISLVQNGTRWMYASPHSSLVSSPHPVRKIDMSDKYVSADISGSFRWSNILARSLCGAVAIGLFHGKERIFKTIDKSKKRNAMELFNNEVSVYKALESLQGIHIPEFVAYGDVGGLLQVIVLENVGNPITEQQYAERRDDIQKAVSAINSLGYTHGDLRLPNITIDSNNNIRIIDFGMARTSLHPEYLPDS